jgi:hypothetical protein
MHLHGGHWPCRASSAITTGGVNAQARSDLRPCCDNPEFDQVLWNDVEIPAFGGKGLYGSAGKLQLWMARVEAF